MANTTMIRNETSKPDGYSTTAKPGFMRSVSTSGFLVLVVIALCLQHAAAQSLNGKVIYVSSTQEVTIKFRSVIKTFNFSVKGAQSQFEKRVIGDKIFSISSSIKNFTPTNLVVTEGENTHTFILEHKEILDARTESTYDFSTKVILKAETKKLAESQNVKDTSAIIPGNPTAPATVKPVLKTYEEVRALANNAYNSAKYTEARDLYQEGLKIKPNDPWCIEQISNINAKIIDVAYQSHKVKADNAYNAKSYETATAQYNLALKEKPGDSYAQLQLRRIEQSIKDNAYNGYMTTGRDALAAQLFDNAENAFNEVLKMRPNDPEAKKEMAKIKPAKAAWEKKEREDRLARERQKQFNDSISLADNLFNVRSYEEAKKKYKNAERIMPGNPYAAKKIAAIDSIQLEQKAMLTRMKKDSLNMVSYKNEVDKGNKAFEAKDYVNARLSFQLAQKLNPSEHYAAQKMATIDVMLAGQEAEKKAEIRRRLTADSINKAYNVAIRQGSAALVKNKYEDAKGFYAKARELKPEEKIPETQLEVINRKLEEIKINAKYNTFIHLGDSIAFTAKDYSASLQWYDSAMLIKPDEAYPKKQSIAVNKVILRNDSLVARQARIEKCNAAMGSFNKAEAARLDRKYEEAYTGYSNFLQSIDTLKLEEYLSSQFRCINLAKDYISRLEQYKPKPKADTIIVVKPAGKSKRKRNSTSANIRPNANALHAFTHTFRRNVNRHPKKYEILC